MFNKADFTTQKSSVVGLKDGEVERDSYLRSPSLQLIILTFRCFNSAGIDKQPSQMASTSTNLGRRGAHRQRQNRRTRNSSIVVNVDDDVSTPIATCIDLTEDTPTTGVIDLTRGGNITVMDSPVVVLTPADGIGPMRRIRGSGRRGRHRSSSRRSIHAELFPSGDGRTPLRSSYVLSSEDSDSDELPDTPIMISESNVAANETIMRSPEGVKISCPVCLDDTKQIQRSGKIVMSTTCGHIFCDQCIKAAITAQHACPTCRKKLYQRNIHPLFI
ncbi:unnamed protein product [Candidula unifasciata]|uniref:RING-type domain-containing protein n=1 Tax=Candidula unifasciata TaxID=100452 RepID=A0A8S3ZT26_9EUPU|nr:unnamed protein product [Candidula unifasciata]